MEPDIFFSLSLSLLLHSVRSIPSKPIDKISNLKSKMKRENKILQNRDENEFGESSSFAFLSFFLSLTLFHSIVSFDTIVYLCIDGTGCLAVLHV